MSYEFPTQMIEQTEAILGFGFGDECNEAIVRARQTGIFVHFGLSPELRRQIFVAAGERSIKEFCPNDARRFASDEQGAKWASKGRAMISMTDSLDRLLAYGWSGSEANIVIPSAPITTAYRVTEAGSAYVRNVRGNLDPSFRMGYFLGKLVIETAQYYGAAPQEISLETWQSNSRAIGLYENLGFILRTTMPEEKGRLTQHAVGDIINGHPVYEQRNPATDTLERRVFDTRCHYSLDAA